jgi:hypothetical protein
MNFSNLLIYVKGLDCKTLFSSIWNENQCTWMKDKYDIFNNGDVMLNFLKIITKSVKIKIMFGKPKLFAVRWLQ